MMRSVVSLLAFCCACGFADPEQSVDLPIAFHAHALACELSDMRARLLSNDGEINCTLTVRTDRSVNGLCESVPVDREYVLSLQYYVVREGQEVILAEAEKNLHITSDAEDTEVELDFRNSSFRSDEDLDGDGRDNLLEVCLGADPLRP